MDEPAAWSAAIALRLALRIIPYVSNPGYYRDATALLPVTIASYRCAALSWVAHTIPTHNNSRAATDGAADAAASVTFAAADAARAAVDSAAHASRGAAYAASRATDAASRAAYAASRATDAAYAAHIGVDTWFALNRDCDFLNIRQRDSESARLLLATPLWPDGAPDWFSGGWAIARKTLSGTGEGFGLWREWFQRRIDGEAIGFALTADDDEELSRRLIATEKDWWKRPPAEVNADIKAWLDELTPPVEPDEADFSQNPRALTFGADDEGRIGLAPDFGGEALNEDQDARDRHGEARREALAALEASSRDLTQATDIGDTVRDYLASLGETISQTRPSLLVLRGEKLRLHFAMHMSVKWQGAPLTDAQILALESWQRAHSLLVAFLMPS